MRAFTEDGKEVELRANGTWRTVESQAVVELTGFRDVPWGSSPAAAIKSEGREPDFSDEQLLQWRNHQMAERTWSVTYLFANQQLARGKYRLSDSYQNPNRYLMEFNAVKKLLVEKYGKPTSDDDYWTNETHITSPENYGMAVAQGHLTFFTVWNLGPNQVVLSLRGNDDEARLTIEYTNLPIDVLARAEDRDQTLRDL